MKSPMNEKNIPKPNERCYISAPIFGAEKRVRLANFRTGKWIAENNGWYPVAPPDIPPLSHQGPCPTGRRGAETNHNEGCHFRANIAILTKCDSILMMPGWISSWSCKFELEIAAVCGLQVWAAITDDMNWSAIQL